MPNQKKVIIGIVVLVVVIGGLYLLTQRQSVDYTGQTLNVLAWIGHDEEKIIKRFEEKYGVKVNVKTYIGGDQMFALFNQSQPGDYDVIDADPEFIEKLFATGRLSELNPSDYSFKDYLEPFQDFPIASIDGKLYAVIFRFGANALVYNTKYISDEEARSYDILWDPKVKGRVGIWDWYLPNMGLISRSLGNQNPYDLTEEEFGQLRERVLSLKPQVAAIHATPAEVVAALANEQTWIVPTWGESGVKTLREEGHPISWTVPDEGGIMWLEALTIPKGVKNPELAKLYIQYAMTAEVQAKFMWAEAYASAAPNKKAYNFLTAEQRDILGFPDIKTVLDIVRKLSVRTLPVNQSEQDWQNVWQEFKAQ